MPMAASDFHFESACSTPYTSAPSSPKAFGNIYAFYSAPTSPSRSSSIYSHFNAMPATTPSSPSSYAIPFDWEEKPGTPKFAQPSDGDTREDGKDYDFAFDFSGQLEKIPLTAAEELFEEGKIRPLRPPPRLQLATREDNRRSPGSSPKSPKIFRNAFSPRKKRSDIDPFAAAIEKTRKGPETRRGRERAPVSDPSVSARRASRSHSPFRVSDSIPNSNTNPSCPSSLKGSNKKWRLKDLLLFRSASEGRATDPDPIRKYGSVLPRKGAEDVKNASFRSTDSGGSVSGSKKGPVSAHEMHYTANRAVAEEMKRKTFLPYRQGLLACLGFNPAAHGIAKRL